MIRQQIKWVSVAGLMVMLLVTVVFAVPVKAAAPAISDVNPKLIVNDVDNTLTIDGSGFADQAEVIIGSESAVVTFYSPTQLIVRITAGFAPGKYSVTVANPGTPPVPTTWSGMIEVVVPTPTPTPSPTFTSSPTLTPAVTGRPQVVIDTYSLSESPVRYNHDFSLNVSLDNAGGSTAYGLQVTFNSTDLLMLNTGGIVAAGDLGVVGKSKVNQSMTVAAPLVDVTRVSVDMTVSYSDEKGTAYTDKFTLYFPAASISSSYVSRPTATPTGLQRAQLVITNYKTDVVPLQPGFQFTLSLSVQNEGTITAKGVTMIVGGGSASGGGGTPQPGGISGGSGEFTNFAPVGTSNLQSLGDFAPGAVVKAEQQLIVNVSANPGAYPMKISFVYTDGNGNQVNDDQVITLLIYSLPIVDVTFYQPVGELMVGQPGALPLQVTSLGKRTVVLGKMKVESAAGDVSNGEALIGSLDPGGYFTLDSMVTPSQAGPLELQITIEYTDDFNQVQSITKTLSVNVSDMSAIPTPDMSNPNGGVETPVVQQTVWQKIWRFILGLFGLDSSGPSTPPGQATPTQQIPIPIKGGGGKG